MQRNQPNIDGFVVRRRSQGGDITRPRPTLDRTAVPSQYLTNSPQRHVAQTHKTPGIVGDNASAEEVNLPKPQSREFMPVDMTLDDGQAQPAKPGKRLRGKGKSGAATGRRFSRKKIIKWVIIGLIVLLLAVGGYFVYKFLVTSSQVLKGNVIGALFNEGKPLQKDANGRTNILMFGTSEDDPGHDGADLTDSIMIASISQSKKDAFLISVPRDLWIDYDRACPAGYQGKANALYSCVMGEGEEAAQTVMRKQIGEVFGLDVQYAVHVNYTALREAVDALGGITVTIESKDPRGILDRNFDWDCPKGRFTCYNVKYPNGPVTLNGKQALYLARARGANGLTYGLEQANFDREGYQRKILVAIKDKAVSAGTLTNPVAVNGLLETLGKNVRTNFDAEEVKTLVKLGQDIKTEHIQSVVLNDPDSPLVTTGTASGQSIVRPQRGLFDYSEIQAVVTAYATGDTASIEKAVIDVLNASGQAGAAQTKATVLTENKLKPGVIGNAPASAGTAPIILIDLSEGKKPATLKKLESLFKVTASKALPAGVASDADFVIIVGPPAPAADSQ